MDQTFQTFQSWQLSIVPEVQSVLRSELIKTVGCANITFVEANSSSLVGGRGGYVIRNFKKYKMSWQLTVENSPDGQICWWQVADGGKRPNDCGLPKKVGELICQARGMETTYQAVPPEPVCRAPWPKWCRLESGGHRWRLKPEKDGYQRLRIAPPILFVSEIVRGLQRGGVPPWLEGKHGKLQVRASEVRPAMLQEELHRFANCLPGGVIAGCFCYQEAMANATRAVRERREARTLRVRIDKALARRHVRGGRHCIQLRREAIRTLGRDLTASALDAWLDKILVVANVPIRVGEQSD